MISTKIRSGVKRSPRPCKIFFSRPFISLIRDAENAERVFN